MTERINSCRNKVQCCFCCVKDYCYKFNWVQTKYLIRFDKYNSPINPKPHSHITTPIKVTVTLLKRNSVVPEEFPHRERFLNHHPF